MKKYITRDVLMKAIAFSFCLFFFVHAYPLDVGKIVETNETDIVSYLSKEYSLSDEYFSVGDTVSCLEHLFNITTYFQQNRQQTIKNIALCDIIYKTYYALCLLENEDTQRRITYLREIISIAEMNEAWVRQYKYKQDIVNHYVMLIGDLIEMSDFKEASKYNEHMVDYGEKYCSADLSDVLMTSCALNSLMGQFEMSYPIYTRLYTMYDELDNIQRYRVVRELIHFEFTKENYSEVIRYAKLHAELINKSRDDVKESMLDFIGLSYCRYASLLGKKYKTQYEPKVNDIYLEGYEWARLNNKSFLPEMIICWAYYLYGFDSQKSDAIALFYEFLDCLQTTTNTTLMFEHTYYEVEDAQQALIRIILADIINATQPKDLDVILSRYDKVLPYLLVSGEFVQDLKAVLQLVYE